VREPEWGSFLRRGKQGRRKGVDRPVGTEKRAGMEEKGL
jgi:hypothetical protein